MPCDGPHDSPAGSSPEEVPDGASCPICHNVILLQDEAFLESCYHRFCYHCLVQWTEAQGGHPPPVGAWYTCPMCKRPYTFILHDVQNNTFRKHHVPGAEDRSGLVASSYHLSADHSRRRGVYFGSPSRFTQDAAASISNPRSRLGSAALKLQAEVWLKRELQALLLQEDVQLVLLHMLGYVDSERAAARGRRSKDPSWLSEVAGAAGRFVFEHAARLAAEFAAFCDSGLTLSAYDAAVASAQRQANEETLLVMERARRSDSPSPSRSLDDRELYETDSPPPRADVVVRSHRSETPEAPSSDRRKTHAVNSSGGGDCKKNDASTAKRKHAESPLSLQLTP